MLNDETFGSEMNDPSEIPADEILPGYSLKGGVRGQYAARDSQAIRNRRIEDAKTGSELGRVDYSVGAPDSCESSPHAAPPSE
jgi:hypothetical protein